jgi:ribosome-associated protein
VPPEVVQAVEAAQDKKAEELVVLDLRNISDVTDYFVICHGTSDRQVQTISESIEERLIRDLRVKPKSVEGRRVGEWILMDYIDFVVHVFVAGKREFYRLERLWGDAPRLDPATLVADAAEPPGRASRPSMRRM